MSDRKLFVRLFVSEVENDAKLAEGFADDLLRFKTILCLEDEEVVGTVSWDIRGGLDDGVVELIGLGVNPQYRRQGVAKELVQTLIQAASDHYSSRGHQLRVIYLFMEKENDPGRSFYQTMGFKEVLVFHQFFSGAICDDLTCVHDHHPGEQFQYQAHIVRGSQDRVGELTKELDEGTTGARVQTSGGFIQYQDLWIH